jgi:hypothetical protein
LLHIIYVYAVLHTAKEQRKNIHTALSTFHSICLNGVTRIAIFFLCFVGYFCILSPFLSTFLFKICVTLSLLTSLFVYDEVEKTVFVFRIRTSEISFSVFSLE